MFWFWNLSAWAWRKDGNNRSQIHQFAHSTNIKNFLVYNLILFLQIYADLKYLLNNSV